MNAFVPPFGMIPVYAFVKFLSIYFVKILSTTKILTFPRRILATTPEISRFFFQLSPNGCPMDVLSKVICPKSFPLTFPLSQQNLLLYRGVPASFSRPRFSVFPPCKAKTGRTKQPVFSKLFGYYSAVFQAPFTPALPRRCPPRQTRKEAGKPPGFPIPDPKRRFEAFRCG